MAYIDKSYNPLSGDYVDIKNNLDMLNQEQWDTPTPKKKINTA